MLRQWILDEVIGGPTGIDNPAVAGVNIDDYWAWNGHPGSGMNGPSEEDSCAHRMHAWHRSFPVICFLFCGASLSFRIHSTGAFAGMRCRTARCRKKMC